MTGKEITSKVKEIMAEILEIPETKIKAGFSQKDARIWDSLTHLKLVMELENKFEITFNTDEVFVMDTFEEICKLVTKHLK